ncbi:hypothetical protein Sjap_011622 [Stephania japonica]|uniref:Uncharacterized protein n=1 Tax=Stephania japonica TaxID=461633 RepID=A0AAP0JCQ9_9MAGN
MVDSNVWGEHQVFDKGLGRQKYSDKVTCYANLEVKRVAKNMPSSYPKLLEIICSNPFPQSLQIGFHSVSSSHLHEWEASDVVNISNYLIAIPLAFAIAVTLQTRRFGYLLAIFCCLGGAAAIPIKCGIGAVSSGLFVVTLAVLRMYLGWSYVGNRLLSATVEYEETGWYDGQLWVKTAEVLARDRLLGSFSVKPVLNRLKYTLVVLGASLFICILLLMNIEGTQNDSYIPSEEAGGRAVPGVYNDNSARSFEPDAFCGELGVL